MFSLTTGCARGECDPVLVVATVILASSVFLADSFLIYTQVAALACLMLFDRMWINGSNTRFTNLRINPIKSQNQGSLGGNS